MELVNTVSMKTFRNSEANHTWTFIETFLFISIDTRYIFLRLDPKFLKHPI